MERRDFITLLAATPAALFGSALYPQESQRYDLLIKNGELRDPSRGVRKKADVALSNGVIASIEDSIPAERGLDVVNAQGLYVTPGLIDLHTHCFWGGSGIGIEADPVAARSGVTSWVDAGSFGYDQIDGFRRIIVRPAKTRIFAYVYLYPSSRNPDLDPVQYVRSVMRQTGETAVVQPADGPTAQRESRRERTQRALATHEHPRGPAGSGRRGKR